ncbi:diguanylate cyclase [Oceanicoccus sagamiensis]|nr:diguanylate cyclase [Oceanicoccus sagamiensis]
MTEIVAGVSPADRLADAVAIMCEKKCSCVLVSESGFPKGIITERDIVRIFSDTLVSQKISNATVAQVMSKDPVCVQQTTSLYDALVLARSRKLRHLLVINEHEQLVGLVTQTDMVDAYVHLIERQSQLETENHELHLLSNEDALMKIGNRRAMEVELNFTEASARRYKKGYAVALMDVDFFKKYNDYYGHQRGDNALRALADVIKESMRVSDRAYRYGGEEILLLMPETNAEDAIVASERVRAAVEAMALPHSESPFKCLTISVGVAASCDQSWQQLLELADQALYDAKNSGRNKVVVSPQ